VSNANIILVSTRNNTKPIASTTQIFIKKPFQYHAIPDAVLLLAARAKSIKTKYILHYTRNQKVYILP